ncbi:Maf-like protein YceF [Pseudoalteromonas sp. THAF3]|uniref:Maf family protein n=1 Tax=Pseudoalteromonas sp. THAF3 TaxID=2587843 RepID=UPI001269622E|nr:Maf family protein [Pseudoalteromonas sp. THAF3]QFU05157.1 Maf-like protein YceF [Pseudoalteromonas sp. THAF3]
MKLAFILASSSPFRQQLLKKIIPEFTHFSPDIDETPEHNEAPEVLVRRLALAKANAAHQHYNKGIVIGSDQVAVHQGDILGKPHTVARAQQQLARFSGDEVTFLTSLALLDLETDKTQVVVEPFTVQFRTLSEQQIANYIAKEQPLNCAGSFKSEGLGVCLFARMQGNDANSLVGLPLLQLNTMLLNWQIDPLAL